MSAEVACMSQTLTLSDDLFGRLYQVASQQGVAVEQLLAQWLDAVAGKEIASDLSSQEDLALACTRSLLDGNEPPLTADWDELLAALQSSEPPYPSVEEAMS